uniref:Dynein heavy chain hydrolytic ATP-binding dynein motor region domain-containing protein n=1 Tax=Eptatretus burgeri TaxID=7764 RepID=A0A8C4PXC6_EPTBU
MHFSSIHRLSRFKAVRWDVTFLIRFFFSSPFERKQVTLKNAPLSVAVKQVELNSNSGIFITLNPVGKGYGGRQRLPDNLQQLFRPVAMVQSDNELIATVLLQAEGFREARNLGRKLLSFFTLASELLSPQQHYDWGLRALKSVLQGCGDILRQDKLQNDQQDEVGLAVKALRLGTQSKLTFVDIPRFEALIADIFPATKPSTKSDVGLQEAFQEACQVLHLIPLETQHSTDILFK